MPTSAISKSFRPKSVLQEAPDEIKWYDAVKQDAQPEAGFIVTATEGRCTYSWMQFNGALRPRGENKCILRMGKEEVIIDFPDKFPIEQFEEALRTQRLQRVHQKIEENLKISVVEVESDEF